MNTKTIFILGGYGGTGRVVCRRLLEYTDVTIVIGGRKLEKLEFLANDLRRQFPSERIRTVVVDASDSGVLVNAFKGCDLVLVASATPQHTAIVARSALVAGCDYLDYHFNNDVPKTLEKFRSEIENAGRCFITQAGFHQGLPAVFVRAAAPYFTTYVTAFVGMVMSAHIENPDSIYELVDELQHPTAEIYKNGRWQKGGFKDSQRFDFGRFGKKVCFPIKMPEMHSLPEKFGLQRTGVFIAGFNWFTDYVVFPFGFILGIIFPGRFRRTLARLITWGNNRFQSKDSGVMFVLDAEGQWNGLARRAHVVADHSDAYEFTALPIVACIKQYLDGTLRKPGIWIAGLVVNPVRMFQDLKDMGIHITIEYT